MSLNVRSFQENGVSVIEPDGRIDTPSAHELEEAINGELKTGSRRFLIDFAAVDYISSAGLRVLLMLGKKLIGAEERLVLCSMSRPVAEVFDIAGLATVFDIQAERGDAMRRLTVTSATVDRVKQAMTLLKVRPGGSASPHLSETAIVGYELLTRKSIRPVEAGAAEAADEAAGGGGPEAAGSQRDKPAGWLKRFGKT